MMIFSRSLLMMMICSRFDQGHANRLEGGVCQEPVEGDEGNVRPESDQCNPHWENLLFVMILIMFICKIMTTIMRLTIPAPHVGVEKGEGDKDCPSMAHHLSW